MKQIQELIKATQVLRVEGNSDTRVSRLAYDSRRIAPGDCFFAVSGTQSDGHAYIDAAVTAGAAAVVCQRLPEHLAPSVCYVVVADTNAAMADMAAAFYGDPSRQLKLVGITGTNGKTTTVTQLYDLFRGLGYKVEKKEWSDEQLDILGIDKKYMPRILKPWDIVGGVSEEMAARTGLVAGTPVCASAGDNMLSMLGSGVFEVGQGVDVACT